MDDKNESNIRQMREIKIEKVIVNIGVGQSGEPLERAKKVLGQLTSQKVCTRRAKNTIKDFGIRKGEPIACLVTLRKDRAIDFLKKAMDAIGNKINSSGFDDFGNFSFGIKEHIDIPGTKYVPELGIIGMDVIINLERPGYRIKRKKIRKSHIGKHHQITKKEAIDFFQKSFGIEVV